MTIQEKAVKFATSGYEKKLLSKDAIRIIEAARFDGYIAGATDNGIVWHKVADGDIPPDRHNVLSEKGEIVVMKDMRWFEFSPNYDNIPLRSWEQPRYWCEMPKFEEKE